MRLKRYFTANPGTLFILAFQILLISAVVLLESRGAGYANEIASYAFYGLIIGLAIQIGIVIREERKRSHSGDNSGSDSA